MPKALPKILPLRPDIQAQIKSSLAITSLNEVILELLKNSLDAESRVVHVTVGYERGSCVVEDDGAGIPAADFGEDGGLGLMHYTSEANRSSPTYGQYGRFLASLAALSLLNVTSRNATEAYESTVTFHHSKVIARVGGSSNGYNSLEHKHGTKVIVHDLFGNLPVRVKQRAMRHDNQVDLAQDHERLKKGIVALLLAWAKPVRIIVADSARKKRYILRNDKTRCNASLSQEKSLASSFQVAVISSLLAQAGYVSHSDATAWVTASARTSSISISAAICREASPAKETQFISLGIRPVISAAGESILFDDVNHMFSMSSFGAVEDDENFSGKEDGDQEIGRYILDSKQGRMRKQGIAKRPDRWPVFYIRIEIEPENTSAQMENAKADNGRSVQYLQKISSLLRSLIHQFLHEHHLRPRAGRSQRRNEWVASSSSYASKIGLAINTTHCILADSEEAVGDPTYRVRFRDQTRLPLVGKRSTSQAFQSWSRLKSGSKSGLEQILAGLPVSKAQVPLSPSPNKTACTVQDVQTLIDVGRFALGESAVQPFVGDDTQLLLDNLSDDDTVLGAEHSGTDACEVILPSTITEESDQGVTRFDTAYKSTFTDQAVWWTNPNDGRHVWLNSRTGLMVTKSSHGSDLGGLEDCDSTRSTLQESRSGLSRTTGALSMRLHSTRQGKAPPTLKPKPSSWLGRVLEEWNNPTYRQSERSIPSLNVEEPSLLQVDGPGCCNGISASHSTESAVLHQTDSGRAIRLSKSALTDAQIIGQVDQKFVLVKMMVTAHEGSASGIAATPRQVLVLVDQHAADERCRVEALYEQLCQVKSAVLPRPIHFEVPSIEYELFMVYRTFFASCGIVLDSKHGNDSNPPDYTPPMSSNWSSSSTKDKLHRVIVVSALPALVAERCRLEPKLLVDMLRSEIWSRHESGGKTNSVMDVSSSSEGPQSQAWVSRITTFPTGIVDMLNSRACRSAIMFNDVLGIEECTALVRRLSRCMFPFQCAHGRPSMVAAVGLGEGGEDGGDGGLLWTTRDDLGNGVGVFDLKRRDTNRDFASAFKEWQEGV